MKKFLVILSVICLSIISISVASCNYDVNSYWGVLSGKVIENDIPLSGVKVTSGDYETFTDVDGIYTIPVYSSGATVIFSKDGLITRSNTFSSIDFYTDEIVYDVIMYVKCRVAGCVRNGSGMPIENAEVTVGITTVKTDEQGNFELDNVIGTSMFITVDCVQGYLKRFISTEEMRSGNVNVNLILG